MKQPSNEAILAIELWMARRVTNHKSTPKYVTPFGAASVAAQLCHLGRRYKLLSERLCNEPDPTERVSRARSRVSRGILTLCEPFHAVPDSSASGLIIMLRTKRPGPNTYEQATALL